MDTELLSKKFGQMRAHTRRVKRVKDRLRRKNKAFVRQENGYVKSVPKSNASSK